jgi:DNA polymerase zeta
LHSYSSLVLEKLDLINRYAESSRLYGIPFYDVVNRGSQYRVEAVLLRVMKPLGYAAPSPNREQVANQSSIEVIPLVLEPDSQFYTDPVVVFDFQSLYPSMILAYNLCYSTCVGRLTHDGDSRGDTTASLGFVPFPTAKTAAALAESCGLGLKEEAAKMAAAVGDRSNSPAFDASTSPSSSLSSSTMLPPPSSSHLCAPSSSSSSSSSSMPFVLPTGTAFVRKEVREGVLPRMLREILETRFMVKRAMKRCLKDNNNNDVNDNDDGTDKPKNAGNKTAKKALSASQKRTLHNVLHSRQLALKMIANVTYGYTAASFSGRMPCSELADAIVKAGRSTLEHAIEMVQGETTRWRDARVVYG